MISLELFITFLITTIIFAYIPGPAMLYTAAQTLSRGRKSGLMAAFGIFVGGCFHIIAASLGLTTIFQIIPKLYDIIKILGALYLVWLGIKLIRSTSSPTLQQNVENGQLPLKQSILVEVLNPKTAIFYIAFLPQFINTSLDFPVWSQFIILGLIVNLIFVSADVVCVFLANYISQKLTKSKKPQKSMSVMGGLIFMGLGVFLGFKNQ
ncbi:LysE family translocator [Acinetobacter baumannii]|uniref:LysE family translocator n=1 Tax=Acinetobacter baumannii TaxID=470 RepID=UPI0003D28DF0|nr:LysE family translocator [Acinetobacter baumannii]AHB89806.1 lysine exporter LysE/YggA [Acinetobacter baumannii ZW85-1]MDC4487404.1 LysE family translocator [Acinetobacter baumannii]MDC5103652.1 LysE family translocator [Acinetobacter baumannii]MDC5177028.1 LysE family translocator [Acinetobacter baumannii]MDC5357399.1 LysE family translocator [Acinetobacter baumannii]